MCRKYRKKRQQKNHVQIKKTKKEMDRKSVKDVLIEKTDRKDVRMIEETDRTDVRMTEETDRMDALTEKMDRMDVLTEKMTEETISEKIKIMIVHKMTEEKIEEIQAQAFQLQKLQCRSSRTEKLQIRAKIKTIIRRKIIVLMMAIIECRKVKKVKTNL